jgi:hypothetical protein
MGSNPQFLSIFDEMKVLASYSEINLPPVLCYGRLKEEGSIAWQKLTLEERRTGLKFIFMSCLLSK